MTRRNRNKRPILRGFVFRDRGATLISVHCPFCDAIHTHGWAVGAWRPEHRVAHCPNFQAAGYWIAPFRRTDLEDAGRTDQRPPSGAADPPGWKSRQQRDPRSEFARPRGGDGATGGKG